MARPSSARGRVRLWVLLGSCAAFVAVVAVALAVWKAARVPDGAAARAMKEGERGRAAREAIALGASAFCQAQIVKQVKPPSTVRFEPREERLGYDPVRGEAYVVGALDSQDGGAPVRHEYVCRLKRQGGTWLALLAVIR